jgi:transposase
VLANKGYGSDAFVAATDACGATPVIPPKSNRKTPRVYGKDIYKGRNLVGRLFQKLKECRRVATRYERLATNYMAMLCLASTVIWLK